MRLSLLNKRLLKDVRSGLSAMHEDIQQLIRAMSDQAERQRQQERERQREHYDTVYRILTAEREIEKDKQRQESTYKNLHLWIQTVVAFSTTLAFLAAAIYAAVAIGQWRETAKAAEAAKSAADTAARELELSERPWITADIKISGPLVFDSDGAHMSVQVFVKNSGHSPAFNGAMGVRFFPTFMEHYPEPRSRRDALCKDVIRESSIGKVGGLSQTWFPGDHPPSNWTVSMSRIDIENAMVNFPRSLFPNASPKDPNIHPVLIACIAYRSTFADTQYHTAFVLDIVRSVPPPWVSPNGSTPASELTFVNINGLGVDAN